MFSQLHPHAARDNDTPLKDGTKDGAEQAAQVSQLEFKDPVECMGA